MVGKGLFRPFPRVSICVVEDALMLVLELAKKSMFTMGYKVRERVWVGAFTLGSRACDVMRVGWGSSPRLGLDDECAVKIERFECAVFAHFKAACFWYAVQAQAVLGRVNFGQQLAF